MFTPAPTCSPCRHALYTGLFPVRSGAYPNHTMVDEGTKSLFTHLKERGYRVGLQAKSHVSPRSAFPDETISGDADDAAALAARIAWLSRRPAEELYDLETDPYELKNRAEDPALDGVRARLGTALDGWMRQQGDRGLETENQAASRQPRQAKREAAAGDGKRKAAAGAEAEADE